LSAAIVRANAARGHSCALRIGRVLAVGARRGFATATTNDWSLKMLDLKRTSSKAVAAVTACAFGVMTINCTATEPAPDRIAVTVTAPDGTKHVEEGDWEKMVQPLTVDFAGYEADGVKTKDPAALLTAERAVFTSPQGGTLVIVRTHDDKLAVDSVLSSLDTPIEVSWSDDLSSMTIDTPDGPARVELAGVPEADRARMLASLAASALASDARYLYGGVSAEYAHPVVIIFGIVFASWTLCVTIGVWICSSNCASACGANGVLSSTMNCGVNITPGTGGGALGTCTCNCNPPPPPPPRPES
jgi:hypothetical protein